jgi:hypothetical protein
MAENDIVALKELASGGFLEVALAPADIAAAPASHTHAAADIASGVLDFDRIQQVLEVESDGTSGTPTEVDLSTNIVGGNLHALVVLLGADSEAYSKVVLPALGAAATGKVTVRVNEFEDASDDFVQIVLDDDTAIFPASSYAELDPDEELTFRWNNGRWDLDLRPNPAATAAVSIFKPSASGTLALTQQSSDMEITDSAKGIILKSANNTRWRITINDDGTLSRAALALMTLLAFATSGMAQVRDMVTDTNGNIVTGRTNVLAFTNNLRFTPLTNANSRTAIIGTNGALTAGNPPSGAAANGSLLTADGSGSSAFAALALAGLSNVRILSATNSLIVTNSTTLVDAPIPSFMVAANKNYFIFAVAHFSNTNTGGFNFVMSAPSLDMVTNYAGPGIYWLGGSGTPSAMIATSSTDLRVINRNAAQPGPSMSIAVGAFRTGTNGGTAKFQFGQGVASTNTSTLHSNTQILIIEL